MPKKTDTRIPVTNNDPSRNMHVGGIVIRPGETRHIAAHLVPSELPKGATSEAAVPEPTTKNPVHDMLNQPIATIVATLSTLSEEQLTELDALETEAKNRIGVHEAITAERLRRASEPPQV